jgi:hypothetical protein
MKLLIVGLSMVVATTFAHGQVSTTTSSGTTGTTTRDVQTAVDLYKSRASEGGNPTLTIKNGEASISEGITKEYPGEFQRPSTSLYAGEYAGEFGSTPATKPYRQEIDALKAQVETLQKLNDALEKELATCQSKPGQ